MFWSKQIKQSRETNSLIWKTSSIFLKILSYLLIWTHNLNIIHSINLNKSWVSMITVKHFIKICWKITKMNYLNYLKTEHIINIMLTLHSDHQEQMKSVVDVMLMSEQKMIIAILQKNSVKMKDIQKKLHKLRVLYELNKRRNNELMLWKKMRSLTEIIEKLTR